MLRNLRTRAATAVLLLLPVVMVSCGDDDPGPSDPETTGDLRATVTADGTGLADVTVRLFEAGGTTATATQTTGSNGQTTFSDVEAGAYEVEIELPEGFLLETGEDDRQDASVTAGSTTNVEFALTEEEGEGGEVVVINASGTSFSETDVTIAPGTTVRWVSQDDMGHTVTPDGHTEWTSASLNNNGDTFEHTFDDVGEFPYFCTPHQAQGMTGVITVEAP